MARLQSLIDRNQADLMTTKRQRAVAEEDFPLFQSEKKESEHIERAKQRIKELQLLIKHWRKQ